MMNFKRAFNTSNNDVTKYVFEYPGVIVSSDVITFRKENVNINI